MGTKTAPPGIPAQDASARSSSTDQLGAESREPTRKFVPTRTTSSTTSPAQPPDQTLRETRRSGTSRMTISATAKNRVGAIIQRDPWRFTWSSYGETSTVPRAITAPAKRTAE